LEKKSDTTSINEIIVPELRIQKNDIISIQVYSASTKPEIDELYNLKTIVTTNAQGSNTNGFLVDMKGNIEYPRLGVFHVEGLTKDELALQIKKRLTEPIVLLVDPTVLIRFQDLQITVLGQVNAPGLLKIPGEQITILEAIGLAGDINEYGKLDGVKVIRKVDNKIQTGIIDLTSNTLFSSPYFQLMQNDVIMVQASKKKLKKMEQDAVAQRIGFGISIITAFAFIFNIFK
jgi:polysaccharide export outer membrane protein